MRLMVLGLLLCGCGADTSVNEPADDYVFHESPDAVKIQVESPDQGTVGVLIRRGWPRHVTVWSDEQTLEMLVSDEDVQFFDADGLIGVYDTETVGQMDDALMPYRSLLAAALPLLNATGPERDVTVGAPTLQSAAITGSEGYWCGVGTAGAMIVGGPGSAFLYAVACGLWADMDSW